MTADELRAWALANGWQMSGGHPSLMKPSTRKDAPGKVPGSAPGSAPGEAIVRLVLKATVVAVEVKKPAGKWEKVAGQAYAAVQPDPETGMPQGLGFESIPSFSMLMQKNKDRLVFAKLTGAPPSQQS